MNGEESDLTAGISIVSGSKIFFLYLFSSSQEVTLVEETIHIHGHIPRDSLL